MSLHLSFVAKKLVAFFLVPPALPLLLMLAGLILLNWRPRAGKTLAWCGLLAGLLLATPFTVSLMARPLESYGPARPEQLSSAQAIVILGGGYRLFNREVPGPLVNRLTLERLRYGAQVARQTKLPILVTGGGESGERPEGVLMADSLERDFGVKAKWVEAASLDTADNARYSSALLKGVKVSRIVLVTHAAHMRRAVAEFESQGMEVVPAPMGYLIEGAAGEELSSYLPNNAAVYAAWYASHEWLGLLAQKIRLALHRQE